MFQVRYVLTDFSDTEYATDLAWEADFPFVEACIAYKSVESLDSKLREALDEASCNTLAQAAQTMKDAVVRYVQFSKHFPQY